VLSIFPSSQFPIDERLTNIVARLAKKEHQYLPMAGYPPLLSKIALLVQSSYGRTPNPETEILVTAGAHKPFSPQYKPWLILMTRSLSLTPVMII
jgi:aspartate/methionine/tyrosine aminotransferase